jgi:hypothetical protein
LAIPAWPTITGGESRTGLNQALTSIRRKVL